jgi:hypothetical protein
MDENAVRGSYVTPFCTYSGRVIGHELRRDEIHETEGSENEESNEVASERQPQSRFIMPPSVEHGLFDHLVCL